MSKATVVQTLAVLAAIAGLAWFFLVHQPRSAVLDRIASNFRDPASVEFSDLVFGVEGVCGSVNAKNGFGAYTGRNMFIASDDGFSFERFDVVPVVGDTVETLTARQDAWMERYRLCKPE